MIEVNQERCTGCGACLEACAAGALSIQEGRAVVDQALCRSCDACVAACPEGALVSVAVPVAATEPRALQARPAQVIDVAPVRTASLPWRRRILPVLAEAIGFAGREVLPRILEVIASQERQPSQGTPSAPDEGQRAPGGQRSRQRHRGRHGGG